jgi:hypothetical protein
VDHPEAQAAQAEQLVPQGLQAHREQLVLGLLVQQELVLVVLQELQALLVKQEPLVKKELLEKRDLLD